MTTKAAAHALLDRARDGEDIPAAEICEALRVTGDLDAGTVVQISTPAGEWNRRPPPKWPRASWFAPIH